MKRLYSCTAECIRDFQTDYTIQQEVPTCFKAYPKQAVTAGCLLRNMYWWLITGGKYRVWCAYDGETVIHTSYVIPACSKFPFLTDSSFEIGPCHTEKAYRGKGIYPAVLSAIVANGGTAYMIIEDTNHASIRGVTKVGFTVMPGEVTKDALKRFVYTAEK